MAILIDQAHSGHLDYVARNMRERDLAEFSALYPVDDRDALADLLVNKYGDVEGLIVAGSAETGLPIAVGGAIELRPNVLSLFFLATPDFPRIATPLTRFIRQRFFPPLIAAGAHRIEAVSLHVYEEMHRWLRSLGLSPEGVHACYGKRGETFVTFAWTANASPTSH